MAARESLDRILASLQASNPGAGDAPITDSAPLIQQLAEEGAKKIQDTELENDIAKQVSQWRDNALSARSQYERQWLANWDMYQGRQYTVWDSGKKQMVAAANPTNEPRETFNILEPVVRTELAKTGSTHPSATVSPRSNDTDDLMAALAAQSAWEWWYEETNFHVTTFTQANLWRTVTGNGFTKTYFDTAVVDPAATDAAAQVFAQQQQQLAASGAQPSLAVRPDPVFGQIRSTPVTPFHLIVPDLTKPDLQDQDWVQHQFLMSISRAKAVYGKLMGPDWAPAGAAQNSIADFTHLGIPGSVSSNRQQCLVVETWVKPGGLPQLPAGGLIITVDDRVVGFVSHYPYDHGLFPFAHLPGIEQGGFYRKSIVESGTPLQKALNRLINQQIKHHNLILNPGMFYDEGSLDPSRIRPVAGQYVPVRLGMKDPRPIEYPQMPASAFQFTQTLQTLQDDITGQHQVSRATAPGADTAASAISTLQEVDDNFLVTVFDGIRLAMTQIAKQVIGLMVQFWDEPRMVKIVGDEAAGDAQQLMGSDIASATDIRIDADSMLPQSKSGRIATITDWMDKGYIPVSVGLDSLEMGQLGKAFDTIKADQNSARRENVAFQKLDPAVAQQAQAADQQAQLDAAQLGAPQPAGPDGQPQPVPPTLVIPINWYDNDQVHIDEHKLFAKGQAYQLLDPAVQLELQNHVGAHEARLAASMAPAVGPDGQPIAPQQGAQPAPAGNVAPPSPAAPQG